MAALRIHIVLLIPLLLVFSLLACTRKDLEFGPIKDNDYSQLVYIDSVGVQLSTVVSDSFVTSAPVVFVLGRYRDNYLGTISAAPYFQLNRPDSIPEIPASALFDSLTFVLALNDYYYGDTTRMQTVYVRELAQTINYSYNSKLYNTSTIAVKAPALGQRSLRISPIASDSIVIRLSDAKGAELFSKLRQRSSDLVSDDEFLNYFRGISIAFDNNDTTAVYGLLAGNNLVMRLHYHTTIPYAEPHLVSFTSRGNDLAFNQLLTNRAGTGLLLTTPGTKEFPASSTGAYAFAQPGTGIYLKTIFPSLRTIRTDNTTQTQLLRAELIIRPAYLSFDKSKNPLPARLFLVQTDASNTAGNVVLDSTATGTLYASPVLDDVYGENNFYRFNITPYINAFLQSSTSSNTGFFVMPELSSALATDRLVVSSRQYIPQLRLTVLRVKK